MVVSTAEKDCVDFKKGAVWLAINGKGRGFQLF